MNLRILAAILAAGIFWLNSAEAAVGFPEVVPFEEDDSEVEEIPEPEETPPDEGDGLEFLMYNENGVMAFAIIAAHEKYQLRPILARNQIQGRATVAQMTKNLDDIAIINASYFMPNGTLLGVTKIDGEIVGKDDFYRSAIGLADDGTAIFGRVRYQGRVILYGAVLEIWGVNCERIANSVVLYNNYFGATTATNDYGVEILVIDGEIAEIYHKGNNPIPANGYVISAHGHSAEFFKRAQVGTRLRLSKIF